MRTYVVQPGDSPASIAAQDGMAGCPKCAVDLVRANSHKRTRVMPNGFVTFESLVPGEKLRLPEKWFNGSLDDRPKAYFAALAHPDGVTFSSLGDAAYGVLSDYAALDVANDKVAALSTMNDQPFIVAVGDTAAAVDDAVKEVTNSYSENVRASTARARARNSDLNETFVAGGDTQPIRNDILNDFSAAMVAARLALKDLHDTPAFPSDLVAAAQAAAAAIAADPNYCASVARTGTSVNSAVHAFKTIWNASQAGKVPVNTGNYEQATAEAIAAVVGGAPLPCAPHATAPTPIASTPAAVVVPQQTGMSAGSVIGIGLLGAGVVGGAIYLSQRHPIRKRR